MKKNIVFLNLTVQWRLLVLFLILLGITPLKNYAVTINGPSIVMCRGESAIYYLTGTTPNTTYEWSIDEFVPGGGGILIPNTTNTITPLLNNEVMIQWLDAQDLNSTNGSYQISVKIGGTSTVVATYLTIVFATPIPYITTDNRVGCQDGEFKDGNEVVIVDDAQGCVNVCENSVVTYYANNGNNNYWNNGINEFYYHVWNITGGTFSNGQTTITGSLLNPCPNVTVLWGAQGQGVANISVTTYGIGICPATKSICVKIIKSPEARYKYDNLAVFPIGACYEICLNHTVNFQDISTASFDSPILFWEWDFGDGSPTSAAQNPSHTYTTPGEYTAILRVTNKCGCISGFKKEICVLEQESPKIYCTSVECENNTAIYHTDAVCEYIWTIAGGTLQPPAHSSSVTVKWDNIGADGFGYVSLLGLACNPQCPNPTTIKIPVIQTQGSINGPTNVCANSFYRYKLPAWPATNFKWEFINNSNSTTFVSYNKNSNEVEILTGSNPALITLKCTYINTVVECQGEASIGLNILEQPTIVNPPTEICILNAHLPLVLSTSIPPNSPDLISWTIIRPGGLPVYAQNGTAGSASINFPFTVFSVPGTYIIKPEYVSGMCNPNPIEILVKDVPPKPNSITGETSVCKAYPYTYTADLLAGTIVNWTVTGGYIGSIGNTTATGNTVTVIWTGNGSLAATRSWNNMSGCTSLGASINVNLIIVTGSIIVPPSTVQICEDGSNDFSVTTNVIPETYEWKISPANAGSINSGQGTDACTILWNHIGTTNVTVSCNVVKCGVPKLISQMIQIQGTPVYTLTASPNPVCSGSNPTFTLTSNVPGTPGPGAIYHWDFGDGSTGNAAPPLSTHSYSNFSNSNSTYPVSLTISNAGCGSNKTVTESVVVKPLPEVNISTSSLLGVNCNASYSLLLTSSASGNPPPAYQWQYNGVDMLNQTSSTTTLTNSNPPGNYQLMVTGSNNCSALSNTFVLSCSPGGGSVCDPIPPWGLPVFTQDNPILCKEAHCTSVVIEGSPSNILGFQWSEPTESGYTGKTGTSTQNSSPVYHFNKPGLYRVSETIMYKTLGNPTVECHIYSDIYLYIPLVADFTMHLVCNGSGNGYELTLKDHTAKYYDESWNTWQWYIDGNLVGNTQDITVNNTAILTAGSHTVKLIVTTTHNTDIHSCELEQTIVVPSLPQADFTVISSDPQSAIGSYSSCSGNKVDFINTSSIMTDLVKHVWAFGDNSSLYKQDGIRVYDNVTVNQNYSVNLTVTDKYGCVNTTSKDIFILRGITFQYPGNDNQYTNTLQSICPGGVMLPFKPLITGGSPSYSYQWYSELNPIGAQQTAATIADILLNNVATSGTYWVKVTDARGCYINVNPTPAKISFKNPPTAIIVGKEDVCINEGVKLNAISGVSNATYDWYPTPIGHIYTKDINVQGLMAGVYDFTLNVTDANGCSSNSAPYTIIVYDLPPPPTLSASPIDCNAYQLQASSDVSPAFFNWSNGITGSTTDVNHGGAYCVWLTDRYGCQSKGDIEVPMAPSTYFWRFPTGCYSYCPGELPKRVDGPSHINFYNWAWFIGGSGNVVPNNGTYYGDGFNVECDPLILSLPPIGSGSGDYTWFLDNGFCPQESGKMSVEMKEECCNIEMWNVLTSCDGNNFKVKFGITNNTLGCDNASYNLYILDPATMQAVASFTSQSPAYITQGNSSIMATLPIDPALYNMPVKIKIEVLCNYWEHCVGYIDAVLPRCSGGEKSLLEQSSPANTETESVSELSILPNPANTEINIAYRFTNDNTAISRSIQVYDAIGRPVTEIKLSNAAGLYNLNVSKYAQGIYFVEIRENNQHLLIKRIIIHH